MRIEQARKNFEVEIRWRAFPLHPDTPEEGLALEELFKARNIDLPQAMARLKMVADELGLPLGERKKTYNSRRAQELGKWAESKGKGDEFHDGVFRAYFVEGRNIAQMDVLMGVAKSVGLPAGEAKEALDARSFKEAVDEDWKLCYQSGITAVPTFVINGRSLVGAQPYTVIEQFLRENKVKKRNKK